MTMNSTVDLNNTFNVLDPDHHLLEKFQKALKQHLLTQIEHLKQDVFEIETETQKKTAQIEEIGVRAYEYQQKVCSQQKDLENIIRNVETTTAANEQEQNNLEDNKKVLKNIENKLFQSDKHNRDLRKEIDSITLLNKQLSHSETKIESNISVNKRKAEKTRLENEKLAKEKRMQDFMVHALNEEVWRQESELEELNIQIKLKEHEMENLEQKVAIGNTNISALQSEYRGLMHAWNSVIVAIGNRDKGLECLQQDLKRLEEKHKSMITEIEQARKLTKRELLENETLTFIKKRIVGEVKSCRSETESQLEQKGELENKMLELQSVLDKTEEDIRVVQEEMAQKKLARDHLTKDYDRLYTKKMGLEQEILTHLQSELINNKSGRKIKLQLQTTKEKKSEMLLTLREVENRQSFINAETASQKSKNQELKQINQDLLEQFEALEKEQKALNAEKEKYEFRYRKKENLVEVLNHRLEQMIEKRAGEQLTKEERRMKEIEKMIEEEQQSLKKLQIVWLREQNNILAISSERQDQIQNVNLLKKQVLILEQKNVRISDEIEDIKKHEEKVKSYINTLTSKAAILCNNVFRQRNKKVDLDKSTTFLQGTYETKLKDSELELLGIESEIADIEEDKVTLSKELLNINREVLEWEKTFITAKDALTNMKEARGKGGELTSMRLEIHKMEVIYGQLKKAQDKLLKDMEYCISRRDNIFYRSEAMQSKCTSTKDNHNEKIRLNITKKLDNLKNQIKQAENDIALTKKKIRLVEDKKLDTLKNLKRHEERTYSINNVNADLQAELEETKINREFKFELLVLNQRKAFMYKQIIKQLTPYVVYKKEEHLVDEYNKAKTINGKLVKITEHLKRDFPDKKNMFIKIDNTLGVNTTNHFVLQKQKKADLLKMCNQQIIPSELHSWYQSLPDTAQKDYLSESDVDDNIEEDPTVQNEEEPMLQDEEEEQLEPITCEVDNESD